MKSISVLWLGLIAFTTMYGQGAGVDSLRFRSNAGGAAWLLYPQTATAQYRLLLPASLGTSSNQILWVNGTTGQLSLLPPGTIGQILQLGAGGLTWVDLPPLIVQNAWSLVGNTGTNPGTNFLGTTDGQPLVIRTSNTERMRITAAGSVGVGTTSPGALLSLGTSNANTKLAVYDGGSDLYGFGIQGSQFRIHLGNSGARFSFLNAPVGTEVVTIQGSGNVGIGVVTPTARLHVAGDIRSDGHVYVANTNNAARELRLFEPSGSGAEYTAFRAQAQGANITYTLPATLTPVGTPATGLLQTDASGNLSWVSHSVAVTTYAWSLTGNSGTNPATNFLGTTDGQPLVIRTSNTERMRITAAGSVGIGTTSPGATLDVSGTVNVTGNASIGGSVIALPNIPSSSTATEVVVWNGNNLERRPAAGLMSANAWSLTGNSGTNPATNFLGTTDAQPLVVRTDNTERVRILSTGQVGIGVSAPSEQLVVAGNIGLKAGAAAFVGTLDSFAVAIRTNNTARVTITADGKIGVGTTAPSTALHVSASANPLRLDGVLSDTSSTVLVLDTAGIVKKRSLASITGVATFVRKTSNQSVTSSTTYQNDNALVYAASANQIFEFEAHMFISGGNGGIKIRVNIPSGASMKLYAELKKDDQHHWRYTKLTTSSDEIGWDPVQSSYGYARLRGIIVMGSTSGNVQVRWAQNSSNSTATTVESGSYLKITPVQ